jgi:hypothetical protein
VTDLAAFIHSDVPCLLGQHTITDIVHLPHATSGITVLNLAVSLASSLPARRCARRALNALPRRGRQARNKAAATCRKHRSQGE